ncbi:MAG TPA: amidase family protein [Pyrinomonadaceae bacterium]|jgi:Asp-tRNA(Asn)/Glu-tRNA(Gln) amidotransferase A subunit family amidase|nr:amidase family protein [Pyrinomonadaceae bacterium]
MRSLLSIALFLSVALAAASVYPQARKPAAASFRVEEATIAQIHVALRTGRVTCKGLVETYLARIDAYDKKGPAINAVVLLNPEALKTADELDVRMKAGAAMRPLECIPVVVKDNYETKGLRTTAGSQSLANFIPTRDAFVVQRIKDAGAIVLFKSNMAEFAFTPLETVGSILPGYTFNPYGLNHTTAGSSGGTAASVAANFGAVGLGTDTGNSIRGPSSHLSLVGIRSTMGLVSRTGVVPLNFLADIAGPMTRSVADAATVLQVIAGPDSVDPVTLSSAGHIPSSYAAFLKKDALKGVRLGVLHDAYDRPTADPEVLAVFKKALEELKAAGAEIVDPAAVEGLPQRPQNPGPCRGFKYDLEHYLAEAGAPVKTLDEIIKSGNFHPTIRRRLESAQTAEAAGDDSPGCHASSDYRRKFGEAVLATMVKLKLDAFVYPTWSNPPAIIGDVRFNLAGDNSQVYAPTTGFPAITVPMGFTRGSTLPAGLTIFGRPWDEGRLFGFAFAYEQATHHRKPPATTPPLK